MKVKIHREGRNIIFVLAFILLSINVTAYAFIEYDWVWMALSVISLVGLGLVVNFFRSPRRHFKGDPEGAVVASVDGTVVALEETYEDEYLHKQCIQLSIFMTIFNVHANWAPVDGEVLYVKHHSGRFLSAYLPKSSIENERSTVVIRTGDGQEIVMRQIAGAIARRIVTYAEPGDHVGVDEHIGFIKFGSRVDVYLPLGTEIMVKLGDKTTGGVTQVARLKGK